MKPIHRIAQIVKDKNLSVREFEREIGSKEGTMDKAFRRDSTLKDEVLIKILEVFPEIRAEWLLTGKGTRLKTKEKIETPGCDEFIRIDQIIAKEVHSILKPLFLEIQENNLNNKINIENINTNLNIISSDLKKKQVLLEKMQNFLTES